MNHSQNRQLQDLKSGRGWIYFILGCLLALFLGGAIRVALSPKRIQNEISARLDKAKVNVAIEGLQVSLNDGIWPRLGFFSSRMTITPKVGCEAWEEIVVENLYLPLGWHHDALAFRTLEADQVRVRAREEPCPENILKPTSSEDVKTLAASQDFTTLADRWRHEVANFQKYLNQVRIHKLTIATGNGRELAFQNLDLIAEAWPVRMSFDWMLSGVGWIQAQVQGQEDNLELKFNSAVKEGQAKGVAQFDLVQGQLQSELDIQHWPLQHLVDQARVWGAKTSFAPKSTWFTCRVKSVSAWAQIKSALLDFDNCSISGSLGTVQLEDLKFRADAIEKFSPFRVVVEKLDLRQLTQSLGHEGLSGVLTEFGWLSGNLDIKGLHDLSWKGQLNDAVLQFSSGGRRVYQKITTSALDLQLKDEKLTGLLQKFVLDRGQITGRIQIDLDQNIRNGFLLVQLPNVELNPEVQNTMIDGQFSGLSLQGRVAIEQGQIQSWVGDVSADKIQTRYLAAQGIKVKTNFIEQKLSGRGKVAQILVNPDHSIYSKLQAQWGESEPGHPMQFNIEDTQFTVDKTGLQWKQLFAKLKKQNISGYGFWQFDGPVSGEIMLASEHQKKLKWHLKGSSQDWLLVKAGIDGSIRD